MRTERLDSKHAEGGPLSERIGGHAGVLGVVGGRAAPDAERSRVLAAGGRLPPRRELHLCALRLRHELLLVAQPLHSRERRVAQNRALEAHAVADARSAILQRLHASVAYSYTINEYSNILEEYTRNKHETSDVPV